MDERPLVKLKEVAFDPKARAFTLTFARGGTATVTMAATDQNRNRLEVTFDRPISDRPFAALRSMFITEFNNDMARVAVLESGAKGWREEGIMSFRRATATRVWLGRTSPSRHNTSAPDMAFQGFSNSSGMPGQR